MSVLRARVMASTVTSNGWLFSMGRRRPGCRQRTRAWLCRQDHRSGSDRLDPPEERLSRRSHHSFLPCQATRPPGDHRQDPPAGHRQPATALPGWPGDPADPATPGRRPSGCCADQARAAGPPATVRSWLGHHGRPRPAHRNQGPARSRRRVTCGQAEFALGSRNLFRGQSAVFSFPGCNELCESLCAQLARRCIGQPRRHRLARLRSRRPHGIAQFRVQGDAHLVDLHDAMLPRYAILG